ncbi:MAG: ABC transporter substrate-binding protein [Spirochaetes bacterium]|nr:ABC transporter substrate-binding protein [Spirochaetota bacterium]
MRVTFFAFAAGLFALALFTGCRASGGMEVVDRSGRTVTINGPINRIISTAPSNTEIISSLGLAHKLVAIDVHSANVAGVPAGVVELDFFFPDAEVILGLAPDLIIASGHNTTGAGADPFLLLRQAGIPVVFIPMSNSIEDIYRDVAFVADILQAQETGERVIREMQAEIAEIAEIVRLGGTEGLPAVYFEISIAPEMITLGGNSFLDDMISLAGARNIFGDESWFVMPSAEAVIQRNPDIIFTNVTFIDDPIGEIKNRLGFEHINAVINNRIYLIDEDSSMRSSPRIVYALRQMAYVINNVYAP